MAAPLIHLDTGFVIGSLHPGSREETQLDRWTSRGVRVGMSAVAWTEFLCGPLNRTHPALIMRIVGEPEPFITGDANAAAEFFNSSGRRRGILRDCMIAATAVRLGAALATTNPRDFQKMSGLVVNPDW